ncbi:aldo/keto reductase [Oceanibium sediminis]|uniref:aldo/keto reductase n=1 Tax=Oceanibium sediminis TaxID=2026339 RepID=UPI000DD310D1|nr:aldo/keto reductase [Oceanibium sediminis]
MQQRQLGSDGPRVSAVGIGAMSFTDFYGPTNEQNSHAVLDAAMRLGIDHIDTANVYGMGHSERTIGSFLAARGAEARDHFRIATKAAITRDPDTGARCFNNSAAHLEAELDGSLRRLGIEAVDLFYVHRRNPAIEIEAVTETLAGFIKAGKIRAFGFSEIAPHTLRRAAAVHPVAAVQSEYSLQTRAPELGLVQECTRQGAALVAFSPVGRGLLSDTPPTPETIGDSGFLAGNPRFTGENLTANLAATDAFRALAAEMQTAAASLAIAWVLAQGPHVIAIPGTRSVEHLEELAAGAALDLTDDDLARIESLLPVGWAAGDRYSESQSVGPERYS